MKHALVAAVMLGLLAACGGDEEAGPSTSHPRGPAGVTGSVPAAPPTELGVARTHHDIDTLDHAVLHPTSPGGALPSTPLGTDPGEGSSTTSAAEPAERNLGDELRAAIGSPESCIDLATARTLHGHLSISVSATVTPAGGVTRASASGGSLPESVLSCVQARALAARIAAPVEGAPRTISTSLSFDVTTTDDEVTRVTPEWRQPGAVATPGIVLPAVGAEGRPSGAVAPDIVTPAIGATGRPEGSVSPDIVAPAVGGGGTLWPSGAPPPPPTSTITTPTTTR